MNIEAYITSGILEEFVFGTLAESEVAEVLDLALKHPEIREEIKRIEDSFEVYSNAFSAQPSKKIKAEILGKIEETVGFELRPPVLNEDAEIEAYNYWLNAVVAPEFDEMHIEVISESELETMVIAWVKNGELNHTHTEYAERFLIVEGSCTADIGGVKGNFSVGDYIVFPKHVKHSYTVTSEIPMKVVACMAY